MTPFQRKVLSALERAGLGVTYRSVGDEPGTAYLHGVAADGTYDSSVSLSVGGETDFIGVCFWKPAGPKTTAEFIREVQACLGRQADKS